MRKSKSINLTVLTCFLLNTLLPAYAQESGKEFQGSPFDNAVLESFVILRDEKALEGVSIITEKILKSVGVTPSQYTVRIINDANPLAFSFPKSLYISIGLLDILESEDELAAVLAVVSARTISGYQQQYYDEVSQRIDRKMQFGAKLQSIGPVGGLVLMIVGVAVSIATVGLLPLAVGAVGGAVLATSGTTISKQRLTYRKIFLNRSMPHIFARPYYAKIIAVYFKEIYEGFDADKNLKADETALGYLGSCGFKKEALLAVMERLARLQEEYAKRGYASALFTAKPGLGERIKHVKATLEKK